MATPYNAQATSAAEVGRYTPPETGRMYGVGSIATGRGGGGLGASTRLRVGTTHYGGSAVGADRGNGNYAYVDSRNEALRVVGTHLTGTLDVVAKDVRVQVALDPSTVASYRLIGYENRDIADEDFRREDVDAGEMGAGHDVTALIELTLADGVTPGVGDGRLAEVFVRYEPPGGGAESEFSASIAIAEMHHDVASASPALRFAATVAEVAEQVRTGPHAASADWDAIRRLGEGTIEAQDPTAAEFLDLVDTIAARIDDPDARAPAVDPNARFTGTVIPGTPIVSDETAIDVANARRAVRRHLRNIRYCAEREHAAGRAVSGTATLTLRVDPVGRVERASIHGLTASSTASECIVSQSRRIRFPGFERGVVEVAVPLTFTP